MTLAEAAPPASDVITDSQRSDYEANGYLCLPGFVGAASQMLTISGRQMRGAPDWSLKGPPTIFGSQQKDSDDG